MTNNVKINTQLLHKYRQHKLPFVVSLLITVILSFIYLSDDPISNSIVKRINGITYDIRIKHAIKAKLNDDLPTVIIIDIDEYSLKMDGRWPWSRRKMAILINKLHKANVAVIAFDIEFSEPERNPASIIKIALTQQGKPLPDWFDEMQHIVFEGLMGIDFWTGAFLIVLLTGVYTVLGGLRAVVYTETIQTVVLLAGSAVTLIFGLQAIGGWNAMVETAGPDFMSIWKPSDHKDFPWTGIVLGAPILGIWYWCTDQNIVQRVLSAKNISEARRGTIFAGFLKITPLFFFVIPGVIAFSLAAKGQLNLSSSDSALPTLIKTLLPSGLRGMVAAGLLAALMSSLASVFNSCSTLVTLDIYKKLYPQTEEQKLVKVGQWSTIVLVGIGLLFIPFISRFGDTLFVSLQSIQAMIAPPIAAVFLFGIFIKRLNSQGAIASLAVGFVIGMSRFILEIINPASGTLLHDFISINFLHFAFILFVICTIVLVGVSYFTPAPGTDKTSGLTYERSAKIREPSLGSIMTMVKVVEDRLYSILLILAVILVWIFFA